MRLEHLLSGAEFRSCGVLVAVNGGLAQLARAPALQAGGQRFESVILHLGKENIDMLEASKVQEIEIYNEQIKESRQTTSAVCASRQFDADAKTRV